jgi:flavin reductase ActVB
MPSTRVRRWSESPAISRVFEANGHIQMSQAQLSNSELTNAFREAMRGMANSVVMVTTWFEGQPWGLTVSACCAVSAAPPMLLISVGAHTVTAQAIRHSRRFGVNVLSDKQVELAQFGARPQAPKFCLEHCECSSLSLERAPVIQSAVAHFSCRAEQEVLAADHVICIGLVESVSRSVSDRPLLHYERQFHKLGEEPLCTP